MQRFIAALTIVFSAYIGLVVATRISSIDFTQRDLTLLMSALTKPLDLPPRVELTRFTAGGALLGAVLCALCWLYYISQSGKYRDGKEYGSARWATQRDIAPFMDSEPRLNLAMTTSEGLSLDGAATRRNLNTLVIGGSGAGKSSGYVIPNLKNAAVNYAVTDPKGELYETTAPLLEDAGYDVRHLDFINLDASYAQFNPLKYIDPMKSDIAIMKLVNNIMENTGKKEMSGGDQFWDDSMKSLLTCLITWVYHNEDADTRNLVSVVNLFDALDASEEDENALSSMDAYMQAAEDIVADYKQHPEQWDHSDETQRYIAGLQFSISQYTPFRKASAVTKKSIIASIGTRLAALRVPAVQELLSADTIGIDRICSGGDARKVAIFVTLPDEDTTFNFLVAIFYQCLFDSLISRTRSMSGQSLPVPLHCFLDEFANIGKIPNFETLVSTIRSRNISVSIILQNIAQLKAMYKTGWETIAGNCDSILFLGSNEETTTKWISGMLGKETIDTKTRSMSRGRNGSTSTNYQRTGRELMTPDEIAHMDNRRCIYLLRGVHPFYSLKIQPGQKATARVKSRLTHSQHWVNPLDS
ncbi:hypothetical protein B9G54_04465 [Alloscardovia macacae]|uniref:Conjugal transfer protein TraG n=1 Tax=Alloscardovia macacae TaxID=1160091 RepID=A0A1Y2SUA2_9BIFI|nr:type IV secretory system conjugative DNA transfer family protein [Alloscardovia macacae]OTA26520.1 hypothetical protein B9G54_04465 [Alloscardovia macacae]OTA29910.1 hypothetical protein B9T39_01980 [Alloscardovia macacae]